ncbi:phage late control D family protein [Nocardioides sp.]|uniref:phage late control D family protein n=1 Tax=Nocardioides sp. TaxID=35761 RepID=UPI002BDF8D3C|nr:contractile injection system protein, VgrG/Pvc8 family [Nocardioides sp.]HXH78132.1 contractile injection system protein, VgrG/Pvc8 family [Nocardioides sp.]
MPTLSLYSSTPKLVVGGQEMLAAREDLLSLSVDEDIWGMSSLEARLINVPRDRTSRNYPYLDRGTFDFGAEVTVSLGPAHDETELFAGRISALSASFTEAEAVTFSFCAEDRLQDFRLARRTRTFSDVSTADIAESLAADHGLTPSIDLDGPTRRVVNQLNLSDLAFLRDLARADGAEVWLDGGGLHLQRRVDRDVGTVTLSYGASLSAFHVTADLAHQVSDVAVTGWSVADKDVIEETADSGDLGAELAGGDSSGSDVLAEALGERHERLVLAEPLTTEDARGRAKAAYLERARRFVTGTGVTDGTPGLRVGSRVAIDRLGDLFSGEYRVVRTSHRFDLVNGYGTEFDVERVGIGAVS